MKMEPTQVNLEYLEKKGVVNGKSEQFVLFRCHGGSSYSVLRPYEKKRNPRKSIANDFRKLEVVYEKSVCSFLHDSQTTRQK